MQGLSMSSLKKNYSLLPLYICFAVGFAASTGYLARLALFNPDVSWNKKKNPEPWQAYKDKEYKLFSPSGNREPKTQAPEY